jgi:hypothetical protein
MGDEAAPEYQYRIQLMLMDNSFQVCPRAVLYDCTIFTRLCGRN